MSNELHEDDKERIRQDHSLPVQFTMQEYPVLYKIRGYYSPDDESLWFGNSSIEGGWDSKITYDCESCGRSFTSRQEAKRHAEQVVSLLNEDNDE